MNAYLYDRGLCETRRCLCGRGDESWRHMIVDCEMYDDIRNLGECGVTVLDDGSVDFSGALSSEERYRGMCEFASRVFRRRRGGDRIV